MKKVFFAIVLISVFVASAIAEQSKAPKNDPVGKWKFEAPTAPEGFTSGNIDVKFAEKKYSANMTFTGSENKISGENVKFENDSLVFSVYIEGQEVNVSLKFSEQSKMAGKAVYSQGEVALSMTRQK